MVVGGGGGGLVVFAETKDQQGLINFEEKITFDVMDDLV